VRIDMPVCVWSLSENRSLEKSFVEYLKVFFSCAVSPMKQGAE
jgi:hypothetical protein